MERAVVLFVWMSSRITSRDSRITRVDKMKRPVEFKSTYWGHVAGIVATFAIGFIWGGWIDGRTAKARVADGSAGDVVAERLRSAKKQK